MQSLTQISKQLEEQAVTQYHSNSIMCEFLALAEAYAYVSAKEKGINYSEKFQFDYYDYSSTKYGSTSDTLLYALKSTFDNFTATSERFKRKFNKDYIFPLDLPVDKVIYFLRCFSKYVDTYGVETLNQMIRYFENGKRVKLFSENDDIDCSNCMSPKDWVTQWPIVSNYVGQKEDYVRKMVKERGKYEFVAGLGQTNNNRLANQIRDTKKKISDYRKERENVPNSSEKREKKFCPYCGKQLYKENCSRHGYVG